MISGAKIPFFHEKSKIKVSYLQKKWKTSLQNKPRKTTVYKINLYLCNQNYGYARHRVSLFWMWRVGLRV